MFVMGNACPTCDDICPNTLLPDDDDGRQQLDLLRYQRINMQPMTNSDVLMHNSAINAATYELKVGVVHPPSWPFYILYCI